VVITLSDTNNDTLTSNGYSGGKIDPLPVPNGKLARAPLNDINLFDEASCSNLLDKLF
jgi:hypothetical protein